LRISKEELHYLLTGLVSQDSEIEERINPCENFIDDKTWYKVCELGTIEHFESLADDIEKNMSPWKRFILKSYESVPEPYASHLPDFA
jgi:hypothetical protein